MHSGSSGGSKSVCFGGFPLEFDMFLKHVFEGIAGFVGVVFLMCLKLFLTQLGTRILNPWYFLEQPFTI